MDFDLSTDQRALADAARSWFTQQWSPSALRGALDGAQLPDLREPLAEMGFLGILADGGSVLDLALVAQESGRVLAPTPLVGTAARAVTLLRSALHVGRTPELLASIVEGTTRVAVLDGDFTLARAATGEGFEVSGRSDLSLDVLAAATYLLAASGPDGTVLVAVERTPQVAIIERPALDASRDLAGVILSAAPAVVLAADQPEAAWTHAQLVATVVLAAEDLGALERSLEMTVAYAKERQTFGRSIGSYQAVKHTCVDIFVDQELLRSLVWLAAWTADADPEQLALHASCARSLAAAALERATEALIQIHGGIGFTWEHDAHLYWRRAKVGRTLLGDVAEHRENIALLALAAVGAGEPVGAA